METGFVPLPPPPMDGSVSSSASTHTIHSHFPDDPEEHDLASAAASVANSPPSSALPSPPDSPSSDSVSSFPSVSSSFFFSSAAASPPHPHNLDQTRELTEGLIIPSLTLPTALQRPTTYGQAIGDLRLLVLGNKSAGKTFLTSFLLEDNEAVVEVGNWEEAEYGKVLCASTDWVEHKDAHGLEKYEPTRNVEIIELSGYSDTIDGAELLDTIQSIIHAPFQALSEALHPDKPPSSLVAGLVSSSSTPLFTVMIFLLPSAPTALDCLLITELGSQIPLVVLPRLRSHSTHDSVLNDKLSSFQPSTAVALRSGLFNSPETLSLLRSEATDRFLRWREVERTVSHIQQPHLTKDGIKLISLPRGTMKRRSRLDATPRTKKWDKAKWESEYFASFSHDVAKRKRRTTITHRQASQPDLVLGSFDHSDTDDEDEIHADPCVPLDPLHLPSLFLFSISLLNPLRLRLNKSISDFLESLTSERNVRAALFSGFCVGLGIGIMAKS